MNPLVLLLQSDFQGALKAKMLSSLETAISSGTGAPLLGSLLAMQALAQAVVKPKELQEYFARSFVVVNQ